MKKTLLLGAILVGAALLRAGYLLDPHIDSDQATFGLAAIHVLKGEFPIFQWGYHYLGTLQTYLDAFFFSIFGVSREVLNGVPLLLSLIFIWVTYLLGKELLDEKTGLWAAFWSAFGPYFLVLHGAWARHGYMETLIFGSLLLLLTSKLIYREVPTKKRSNLFFFWGLVAGTAWWTDFLILIYLMPCALFLWGKDKRMPLRREFLILLVGFFIGSAPFWIYNFQHHFASFEMFFSKEKFKVWPQLLDFFGRRLPLVLGARENNTLLWNLATIALYVFSALWLLVKKPLRSLLLPFACVGFVLVFTTLTRLGHGHTPRYALPLYSILPIFIARVLVTLQEKSHLAAVAFLLAFLAVNLRDNALSFPPLHPERIQLYREDQAIKQKMMHTLFDRKLEAAYCHEYWVGPLFTFDCREKIIFPHPYLDRYPLYTRQADSLFNPAFSAEGADDALEEALSAMNVRYEKLNAPPLDFYCNFKRVGVAVAEIPAQDWKCAASHNSEHAAWAVDRNMRSVWMTQSPQELGMTFTIELPEPEELAQIELYLGNALKGSPGEMEISLSADGNEWKRVGIVPKKWGYFWSGPHPFFHGHFGRMEVSFQPFEAKFVQFRLVTPDAHHPDYWALSEVILYRSLNQRYRTVTENDVEVLVRGLSKYSEYWIYADVWLSAHLRENYPALHVADTWQAPVDDKTLRMRLVDFSRPSLLIVTPETRRALAQTLKESQIKGAAKEAPPFTLFLLPAQTTEHKWYWTGKQLLLWKRVH